MAESKDQRRSRLNREGKELIASGQEHMLTDQHRSAMEYLSRKNARKTVKTTDRRRAEREGGQGGKSVRATGEGPALVSTKPDSPAQYDLKKRDATYAKMTPLIKDINADAGKRVFPEPSPRLIGKGAINKDDTHHAMMGSIADHLSTELEKAHDNGQLLSKDATHIDTTLGQAYTSLLRSNRAHDEGHVEEAKLHMNSTADHLHSAATQMSAKGVTVHPKLAEAIKQTREGYVRSTAPGRGAMPHKYFEPPAKGPNWSAIPQKSEPKAVTAEPKPTSSDYSRLGKQFEEHQDVHESGYSGHDVTASEANEKFFREQMGY